MQGFAGATDSQPPTSLGSSDHLHWAYQKPVLQVLESRLCPLCSWDWEVSCWLFHCWQFSASLSVLQVLESGLWAVLLRLRSKLLTLSLLTVFCFTLCPSSSGIWTVGCAPEIEKQVADPFAAESCLLDWATRDTMLGVRKMSLLVHCMILMKTDCLSNDKCTGIFCCSHCLEVSLFYMTVHSEYCSFTVML